MSRLDKVQSELVAASVEVWGLRPQLLKTIEELSELQRAISKYLVLIGGHATAKTNHHVNEDLRRMDIYYEIVDVELMIAAIKERLGQDAIYREAREIKLRNLKKLLMREGLKFDV